MSAILLDSDLVHYEVLGRGRPVLFLHSWIGSWRYWIPNMQSVSLSYRAYSLDLWGFGDSAKNQKYSLNEQAELIGQFLDRLGVARIAIVGHGLGALAAVELAKVVPELVDRIFAVCMPFSADRITPQLFSNAVMGYMDDLISQGLEAEAVRSDMPKNDLNAIYRIDAEPAAVQFSALENLGVNCLFAHGKNDPFVLAPDSGQMLRLPEQHHALVFEQSGHFPMLEESSKFNRLLNDFLLLDSGKSIRDLRLKEEWKRRVR
jgi:pimeloyl-ACP methyl ester carboxylesterase